MQKKENVSSSNVALFVGNLPPNLSQRQYEKILVDKLGKRKLQLPLISSDSKFLLNKKIIEYFEWSI